MSSTASSPSASAEGGSLRDSILHQLSGRDESPLLPAPLEQDLVTSSPVVSSPGEVLVTGPVIDPMAEYRSLQRRLLLFTLGLSALAVLVAGWRFNGPTALSVAIGSMGGLVYLFLLSRSVQKLGGTNKQVGKVQLLVPVTLVLLSTRWPLLQLLPALIGFLIYKPAVIISTALGLWYVKPAANSPSPSPTA